MSQTQAEPMLLPANLVEYSPKSSHTMDQRYFFQSYLTQQLLDML